MAGSAMPTTVASIEAMADPSTVASSTQRPRPLAYLRPAGAGGPPGTAGLSHLPMSRLRPATDPETNARDAEGSDPAGATGCLHLLMDLPLYIPTATHLRS